MCIYVVRQLRVPTLEWWKLIVTVRLSRVKFHENLFTVVALLHANRWTAVQKERRLFMHYIACVATDPSETSSPECAIQYSLFKFLYLYSIVKKINSEINRYVRRKVNLSLYVFKHHKERSRIGEWR